MRTFVSLLLLLVLMSGHATAFTTKKIEPRTSRPAFKASPSATSSGKDHKDGPAPASTPKFAFTNPAASMAPSIRPQQREEFEDDEELVGYATAVVSCVISLALGYTLGYAT